MTLTALRIVVFAFTLAISLPSFAQQSVTAEQQVVQDFASIPAISSQLNHLMNDVREWAVALQKEKAQREAEWAEYSKPLWEPAPQK